MPYTDPIKRKESASRRYKANQEKRKAYAREWYYKNRKKVLDQHEQKAEVLKEECKAWRKENPDKVRDYKTKTKPQRKIQQKKDRKKSIDKLANWYVVNQIKARTGLSLETIREHPELIENTKQQIKLKRLLKMKKNG